MISNGKNLAIYFMIPKASAVHGWQVLGAGYRQAGVEQLGFCSRGFFGGILLVSQNSPKLYLRYVFDSERI